MRNMLQPSLNIRFKVSKESKEGSPISKKAEVEFAISEICSSTPDLSILGKGLPIDLIYPIRR